MHNLNVRPKTIKPKNMEVNPHDFGLGYGFLDMTTKAQATRGRYRQIGLHQKFLLSLCFLSAIEKVKRQLTEWVIFPSHISDKGFSYRIYKGLLQFSNKNGVIQGKLDKKNWNRYFSKGNI